MFEILLSIFQYLIPREKIVYVAKKLYSTNNRFFKFKSLTIIPILIASFLLYFIIGYPSNVTVNDFEPVKGTIEQVEGALNKFICKTTPANRSDPFNFAYGKFMYKKEVSNHYELSVSIEDCSDSTVLELVGLNCYFAIHPGSNAYYMYQQDEHWKKWKQIPFSLNTSMNKLGIIQKGRHIDGYVNDKHVGSFYLNSDVTEQRVGLQFKADRFTGGSIFFQDFIMNDLS